MYYLSFAMRTLRTCLAGLCGYLECRSGTHQQEHRGGKCRWGQERSSGEFFQHRAGDCGGWSARRGHPREDHYSGVSPLEEVGYMYRT